LSYQLRVGNNICLEFSYTKDATFVKILRLGLKFPLRGEDICLGPNTYNKDEGPALIDNDFDLISLLFPGGKKAVIRVKKLQITLIEGIH
jgi:hypothetical protein